MFTKQKSSVLQNSLCLPKWLDEKSLSQFYFLSFFFSHLFMECSKITYRCFRNNFYSS